MLIQTMVLNYGTTQTFQVDTLQYNGNVDKYINIVILGDGYTDAEQNDFMVDATDLFNYFFTLSPWSNYSNNFNVFAIKVISAQSGAKHPNSAGDCSSAFPLVPVSSPNTYLGCTFDSYGIHRLVVPANTSNLVNVLANNFPNYDQIFIISNTPYYGGSGGLYSTTTAEEYSNEIAAHEIGHSFANLADEYYAGDNYAGERANMTQQTSPSSVKWKNWMGYDGIGIYQHCCGGSSALWYKPSTSCKMEVLGYPYCSVCKEAIIERIHTLVNPIVSYTPTSSSINSLEQYIDFKLTELIKPIPNTLNITWKLDGVNVSNYVDSLRIDQNTLSNSAHTLTVTVVDTSAMLKVNNHSTTHFSSVSWSINKSSTGTHLTSAGNKIACSVFPNPSSDRLNIAVELEKKSKMSIQIVSPDGKLVEQITKNALTNEQFFKTINIGHLANGTYTVLFKINDIVHAQPFIKQ